MIKRVVIFFTTFLFCLVSGYSFSQPSSDKYYAVTLLGEDVQNTLNTYPSFAYFDFTFVKVEDDNFALEGFARDKAGAQLGSLITLAPLTSFHAKQLKNLSKGHLYLVLSTMRSHNVDGSEDYVLTPKKCKDRSGNFVDYVSYRFSNKVEQIETGFMGFIKVISFELNPSPPY